MKGSTASIKFVYGTQQPGLSAAISALAPGSHPDPSVRALSGLHTAFQRAPTRIIEPDLLLSFGLGRRQTRRSMPTSIEVAVAPLQWKAILRPARRKRPAASRRGLAHHSLPHTEVGRWHLTCTICPSARARRSAALARAWTQRVPFLPSTTPVRHPSLCVRVGQQASPRATPRTTPRRALPSHGNFAIDVNKWIIARRRAAIAPMRVIENDTRARRSNGSH